MTTTDRPAELSGRPLKTKPADTQAGAADGQAGKPHGEEGVPLASPRTQTQEEPSTPAVPLPFPIYTQEEAGSPLARETCPTSAPTPLALVQEDELTTCLWDLQVTPESPAPTTTTPGRHLARAEPWGGGPWTQAGTPTHPQGRTNMDRPPAQDGLISQMGKGGRARGKEP